MIAFMTAAALLAASLLHAYRLAVPTRSDLASDVRRWDTSRTRATRIQRIGAPQATTLGGHLQGWITEQVLRRSRDVKGFTQDLAVSGTTVEQYVAKSTALVMVFSFLPNVLLYT